uniref:Ribonuclease H-like domain-containing protein n=1 Tax=Tanacetum cinerariifolium TaxID=118510 RepID=A0A6L2MJL8_TANCI|nr:ribonuclease H-like domain-containing protein [Tanacetum cinerariifolium]
MLLESVEHAPLIWPTIKENGVTRTKKYEKIQADCDLKAINIILQVNQQTHLAEFPQIDFGLAVLVFKQGDDSIDSINKMMSFLSTGRQSSLAAGTSGTRANFSGIIGNNSSQQSVVKCFNCQREDHMVRQCPKPKRKRDATWFRYRVLLVEARGSVKVLNEEELAFLKNAQFADFEKKINDLKQTLSKQLKEKEMLIKTFNVLKHESKEKETKNIDKEIALKKVKELDNIVYKIGQSVQTVLMLMKPQVFYDNNLKQALGFQNSFYLKKAQLISPTLYDGSVIAKETNVISIADSEETLMLEEEKLSGEQDFWLQTSHPNTDQSAYSLVKIEAPRELPKESKGKDIVDNAAQVSNVITTAPGRYKLDPITLAPKDKNNKETHIYYLKHTMKLAAILREIVKQAKSLNPLDSASYFVCKYVKLIQEFLGYVRDTCPDIHKPSEKLVVDMPINKKKTVRHDLCFIEFVFDMNASSKYKSVKKAKKKKEWKPTGKVFTKIGYNWRPTRRTFTLVGNARPKVPKTNGSNSKPKIAKSVISNKMEPGTSPGSNTLVAPSYSSLVDLRNILTENETKFGNQTLCSYYENVGISHERSVACTLPQNGVVERRNHTLVEATQTMFIYAKAPLFLWAEAVATAFLVANAPRVVDLADSLMSTSIDQDAPSTNSTSQGSSSNVRPIDTLFKSLGRWTKDHPIENVFEDPSRFVSTRNQLKTDAIWCYFDAFLTSYKPKSFKQAMIEPSRRNS